MRSTRDDADRSDVLFPLTEVVTLLRELEQALATGLSVALSEENTTLDQSRVLEAIARLENPTMGEIAVATGMANASLSRIVDGLEDAAHAYRVPDVSDRRRVTVRLTDRGQSLLGRVSTIAADWERATECRLGPGATAALREGVAAAAEALRLPPGQ